jgi:hypothetical protein
VGYRGEGWLEAQEQEDMLRVSAEGLLLLLLLQCGQLPSPMTPQLCTTTTKSRGCKT